MGLCFAKKTVLADLYILSRPLTNATLLKFDKTVEICH